MTLWDRIIRGSLWSSGPVDGDIARYLTHGAICQLCYQRTCVSTEYAADAREYGVRRSR